MLSTLRLNKIYPQQMNSVDNNKRQEKEREFYQQMGEAILLVFRVSLMPKRTILSLDESLGQQATEELCLTYERTNISTYAYLHMR